MGLDLGIDFLPLKAILFDLDGTLINSIDHIVACWQHAVRVCLGREMTREDIMPTMGRALLECFEEIAPGRSEELRVAYKEHQRATHDDMVTLVPGTRETLERLKAEGCVLGLVTSKGLPVTLEGLDLFGLTRYFDTLVTYEDTTRHKPNPDPLLVASERLGMEPADMLYVGDAVVDIIAGKAAGTRTAGVTWGAGAREDIVAAEPDYVIEAMRELPNVVLSGAPSR